MIQEELPMALGITLAMDNGALETYAKMTKEKKKAVIEKSNEIHKYSELKEFVHNIGLGKFE